MVEHVLDVKDDILLIQVDEAVNLTGSGCAICTILAHNAARITTLIFSRSHRGQLYTMRNDCSFNLARHVGDLLPSLKVYEAEWAVRGDRSLFFLLRLGTFGQLWCILPSPLRVEEGHRLLGETARSDQPALDEAIIRTEVAREATEEEDGHQNDVRHSNYRSH